MSTRLCHWEQGVHFVYLTFCFLTPLPALMPTSKNGHSERREDSKEGSHLTFSKLVLCPEQTKSCDSWGDKRWILKTQEAFLASQNKTIYYPSLQSNNSNWSFCFSLKILFKLLHTRVYLLPLRCGRRRAQPGGSWSAFRSVCPYD